MKGIMEKQKLGEQNEVRQMKKYYEAASVTVLCLEAVDLLTLSGGEGDLIELPKVEF